MKNYAPADVKMDSVFDAKQALGLVGADGTEMVIHIGIDTVNLNSRFFEAHVKAGDLLISFDLKEIKAAGYNPVTMLVFPNREKCPDIAKIRIRCVKRGEQP